MATEIQTSKESNCRTEVNELACEWLQEQDAVEKMKRRNELMEKAFRNRKKLVLDAQCPEWGQNGDDAFLEALIYTVEKYDGRSDFSAILKRQFKFNTSHLANEDRLVGSSYVVGKKRRIRDKVKSGEISSLEAERQIAALNNTYGKTSIYADKDKDGDDETIGYENVLEAPGSNVEDILMNCEKQKDMAADIIRLGSEIINFKKSMWQNNARDYSTVMFHRFFYTEFIWIFMNMPLDPISHHLTEEVNEKKVMSAMRMPLAQYVCEEKIRGLDDLIDATGKKMKDLVEDYSPRTEAAWEKRISLEETMESKVLATYIKRKENVEDAPFQLATSPGGISQHRSSFQEFYKSCIKREG